ncbi:MAG: hypothetical protein WCC37_25190 [Candidatus Sulfotelmatobacter sp.]
MTSTEPTTPNPLALPTPNLPATPSTDSALRRVLVYSIEQWETPTYSELPPNPFLLSEFDHTPIQPRTMCTWDEPSVSASYLHALHVIYCVRDVKVKQLEEALRKHAEENALRYELWPSITMRPIYEKAITDLFDNADYLVAQLRKQCDPNHYADPAIPGNDAQTMNASTAKVLGLVPELNTRLQAAPELTCESLQRRWGVTVVRSAVSGIKDARVAVLYDNEHRTIEKQHNRQPLRKLKGRKHDAD